MTESVISSGTSSIADNSDLEDDEGWKDVEPDVEVEKFVSLLDGQVFTSLAKMLEHCKHQYGLDLLTLTTSLSLDFYGTIKLVNYIRQRAKEGGSVVDIRRDDFDDDRFLKPVLEDDAVLFNIDELSVIQDCNRQVSHTSDPLTSPPLVARIAELEEELRRTQSQFVEYRETVKATLEDRWNEEQTGNPEAIGQRDDDTHYFSSYSYNDIHEVMLKDTIRTDAYRDFIYQNKNLFAGKVVLDVGCGTGILSMFCAKAGAARVIAVDNSAIIDKARENVFANGFADTITLLHGKMEDVKMPVDHVDIIVSEWMGYCLLYEAMLDSVIWARDRYLLSDGLMVPSHMNMWMAPMTDPEYIDDHVAFWRDVYGFDMKAMQAGIHDEVLILHMPPKTVAGEPHMFQQLNLYTTTIKDLHFSKPFTSRLTQDVDTLDGFSIWFDTFFLPSRTDSVSETARAELWTGDGVAFTTGPYGKETHWRQGILLIDSVRQHSRLPRKAGEDLKGKITYEVPEDNSRALDIQISWNQPVEEGAVQLWKMK